jgi:hypothetical protein
VARNWDGCVPEISVALVCCVITVIMHHASCSRASDLVTVY